MININNWDNIRKRYEQYWNRENKTPILYIAAPKDNATFEEELNSVDSETFWFDPHWLVKSIRNNFENTYYGGDAYPYVSPSIGPELMSSLVGLEVTYNEKSAWVTHSEKLLEEFNDFSLDRDNWYFKKMEEILEVLTEDAKNGDYIVGTVDLNTIIDGVASLVGPENLCYEIMDNPVEVKRTVKEHFNLYKEVFSHYNEIVKRYQGGNTNWLAIYSDEPWYFISCDFMCMVSPDDFDEFIIKSIDEMAKFHKRALFHLDGENAVIHLDKILEIESVTGVQVQATPYRHSAEFWVPYIQKIQDAGKCVCIEAPTEKDIEVLLENCRPEGLFIRTYFSTEEKAKEIEEKVKKYYANN